MQIIRNSYDELRKNKVKRKCFRDSSFQKIDLFFRLKTTIWYFTIGNYYQNNIS